MTARTLRRELQTLANDADAAALRRFFKTAPGQYGAGDQFLGIRVPVLRRLAAKYQTLPLSEVSALLSSPWHEARLVALLILVRQHAKSTPTGRLAIYNVYMRRRARINNWDLVDCSAEHIVGAQLREGDRSRLLRLATSPRVWDRRIAILATFHYIKRGEFADTLKLAELLRDDPHDLIHKAVGWMLREVGNRNRRVAEAFLQQHAKAMPRTMLRYAIERFPERLRQRYLGSGAVSKRQDRATGALSRRVAVNL